MDFDHFLTLCEQCELLELATYQSGEEVQPKLLERYAIRSILFQPPGHIQSDRVVEFHGIQDGERWEFIHKTHACGGLSVSAKRLYQSCRRTNNRILYVKTLTGHRRNLEAQSVVEDQSGGRGLNITKDLSMDLLMRSHTRRVQRPSHLFGSGSVAASETDQKTNTPILLPLLPTLSSIPGSLLNIDSQTHLGLQATASREICNRGTGLGEPRGPCQSATHIEIIRKLDIAR